MEGPMLFHPYELAFCGFSGSGKTTLAAAVVRILSRRHRTGYFKHGCHRFDIDRKGKDSHTLTEAGASTVMIADPEKKAVITTGHGSANTLEQQAFRDCDLLIIEGLKELPVEKLLVVDEGRTILRHLNNGDISNIKALVVPDDPSSYQATGLPVFHRDATGNIADFIEGLLLRRSQKNAPLNGLVLAGGRSLRMRRDKALITYHGIPQLEHAAALLDPFCREVFISCRHEQEPDYRFTGRQLIADTYLGIGPLGGLLSAQKACPGNAWLILACDMPLTDHQSIATLTSHRNPFRFATAFIHPDTGKMEPLIACYEPKSRAALLLRHAAGKDSLAGFLAEAPVTSIRNAAPRSMTNVNRPEERHALPGELGRD